MQETWVRSLGQEEPLEKEMTTHSSILAWEIPWTREPGGLYCIGSQKLDLTEQLNSSNRRPYSREVRGSADRLPRVLPLINYVLSFNSLGITRIMII